MTDRDDGLRRAVRAALAEPIVGGGHPTVALVRRHRGELTRFFADELGYRLDAARAGVVRLAKLPGPGHEPSRLVISELMPSPVCPSLGHDAPS